MVLGEARLAILLAALLTFPATHPAAAVAPPSAVMVFVAADASVVYWLPAEPSPDGVTYNVYGEVDGALVFIENTRATAAVVIGKYDRFAVTSVLGADESDPVYSIGGICVRSGPSIDTDCHAMGVDG